jgi:polar amino acid transport system substrate-binding protein
MRQWVATLWLFSGTWAGIAQAEKPLQVLVGMNKPPYIQVDSSDGYEIELLREIARTMQLPAEFTYVPNKRIFTLLQQGIGDIATLQKKAEDQPKVFYSCPYIRYQNVAVTLAANQISLNDVTDLAPFSILAFQNAVQVLPEAYQRIALTSPSYRETVDQRSQVDMLQKQRVQVIVMDMNIFHYYNNKSEQTGQVQIHALFAPTLYRAAFRSRELASKFNLALQLVQRSAAYSLLQERYFGNTTVAAPPPCDLNEV